MGQVRKQATGNVDLAELRGKSGKYHKRKKLDHGRRYIPGI